MCDNGSDSSTLNKYNYINITHANLSIKGANMEPLLSKDFQVLAAIVTKIVAKISLIWLTLKSNTLIIMVKA